MMNIDYKKLIFGITWLSVTDRGWSFMGYFNTYFIIRNRHDEIKLFLNKNGFGRCDRHLCGGD